MNTIAKISFSLLLLGIVVVQSCSAKDEREEIDEKDGVFFLYLELNAYILDDITKDKHISIKLSDDKKYVEIKADRAKLSDVIKFFSGTTNSPFLYTPKLGKEKEQITFEKSIKIEKYYNAIKEIIENLGFFILEREIIFDDEKQSIMIFDIINKKENDIRMQFASNKRILPTLEKSLDDSENASYMAITFITVSLDKILELTEKRTGLFIKDPNNFLRRNIITLEAQEPIRISLMLDLFKVILLHHFYDLKEVEDGNIFEVVRIK